MLGRKICKLERFLFGRWIKCDLCIGYEIRKEPSLFDGELKDTPYCKNFHRHAHPSQYCCYFRREEPLKYVEVTKQILKTIGNVLFVIITLPIRPLLNMKAENEYLKEKCEELILRED